MGGKRTRDIGGFTEREYVHKETRERNFLLRRSRNILSRWRFNARGLHVYTGPRRQCMSRTVAHLAHVCRTAGGDGLPAKNARKRREMG